MSQTPDSLSICLPLLPESRFYGEWDVSKTKKKASFPVNHGAMGRIASFVEFSVE